MIKFNLQFFASQDGPGGEKTEIATPKKLEDARKKGQVAKSKELGSGAMLLAFFLILRLGLSYIGTNCLDLFSSYYDKIPDYTKIWNGNIEARTFADLMSNGILRLMLIIAPIFIVGVIVSFTCDLIQVKWKPTTKPLQPKFSKLSPVKGLKRMFSSQALVELLKAILKIGLILYVVYSSIDTILPNLYKLYDLSFFAAIALIGDNVIGLGLKIALIYMILAFADYIYTRWKFNKDMRMTKQEVKDEYKNSEGDPLTKSKIRQRMREASRRRMMQDLPKADVVITNPTHYAVALKYDITLSDAPIVIAKGEDYLALRIKEIAKENHIEIVENKPLARMLYANVNVGGMVPPELYQAVAEVLAFVYQMQGKI